MDLCFTDYFRCECGDNVTEGEGNSKKKSKKKSAELMLDKLQALNLPSVASKQKVKNVANKKKNRNLIKVSFFLLSRVCVRELENNTVMLVCICGYSYKTIHVTVNVTNACRFFYSHSLSAESL